MTELANESESAAHESGLPLDLVLRACSLLPPNDIACTARLLCKASTKHFSAPHHRTVRLSQPVPPHAFAARYGRGADPGPLKRLGFDSKECLFTRTAASGSLDNVATLVERMEPPFWWKTKDSGRCACSAAARARHMHVVRWLLQRGYPLDTEPAFAAVMRHCDLADVQWLLAQEPVRSSPGFASGVLPHSIARAAGSSATADAPEKLGWVNNSWTGDKDEMRRAVALGAAESDNLPALEWALQPSAPREAAALQDRFFYTAAASGAATTTAWLLGRGARSSRFIEAACHAALGGHTAVLALLLPRALEEVCGSEDEDEDEDEAEAAVMKQSEFMGGCMEHAASSGCLEALQYVWGLAASRGLEVDNEDFDGALEMAVYSGNVEAARWLWRQRSCPTIRWQWVMTALGAGVPMLEFVCDEAGAVWDQGEVALAAVLRSRTLGGPVPLLQWLHDRGFTINCGHWRSHRTVFIDNTAVLRWLYDKGVLRHEDIACACVLEQAAASGCVAAVEWLASLQCPMGQEGNAYLEAACNGDLDMLRCLKRLGVPWGPDTVLQAVEGSIVVPAHVVRWMVGEGGAPLSDQAVRAIGERYSGEEGAGLREWLRRELSAPRKRQRSAV